LSNQATVDFAKTTLNLAGTGRARKNICLRGQPEALTGLIWRLGMYVRTTALIAILLVFSFLGRSQAADLELYIGKYTFDKVNGRTLYQIPELNSDFIGKFGNERWNTLLTYLTSSRIEAINDPELGRVIVVWQCRPHDCVNSAVVLLRPTAAVLGVCFQTLLSPDGLEPEAAWSGIGWKNQTVRQRDDCRTDFVRRFKAIAEEQKP
jgi:hypothetical protein